MRQDLIERMKKVISCDVPCDDCMRNVISVVLSAVEESVKPLMEYKKNNDDFNTKWTRDSWEAIDQTLKALDELKGEKA